MSSQPTSCFTVFERYGLTRATKEYIAGFMTRHEHLPKPTDGRKKKSNLVKQWKGEEKKSGGQMYG